MCYERLFWNSGPSLVHSNFLFLGDYVDRGDYGVEYVAYLLALKILAPDKFFICRGNHEVRSIQRAFTYEKECYKKYGLSVGEKIWKKTNRVFDVMPICAVIDNNIFCSHGGQYN